jgi:hypothetical protein
MKVGFRLGKCVLDIVNGTVPINDVMVIIANSRINPNNEQHWNSTWNNYKNKSKQWDNGIHEEVYKHTVKRLFELGKIHQPNLYGKNIHSMSEAWLDIVPVLKVDRALQKVGKALLPDILL